MGEPVPPSIFSGRATKRNCFAPLAARYFQIQALNNVDAVLDEQMNVDLHFGGHVLESDRIRAGREDAALAQPLSSREGWDRVRVELRPTRR